MPPVNTPAIGSPTATRSPRSPQTPIQNRPLTPLSYLSSPAPDLASTLHTTASDTADEANVNFLRHSLETLDQASQQARRTHIDSSRDPRRAENWQVESRITPSQSHSRQQESQEDLSRRERLQRVLTRLNRLHEPSASSTAAYSNRTPSPNRQSLYDWAPAYDDNNQEDNELDAILSELRRQQPDTHPDILRVLSQSQLDGNRQREREGNAPSAASDMSGAGERRQRLRERERERRNRESEWVSLRSRTVLQRARQEGAGSPSATERMLRYVMDRERSGMSEEEERARGSGWFRPSPGRAANEDRRSTLSGRDSWSLPPPTNELRDRDRQERVEAFRRGYLAENVPPRLPRISTPPVPAISTTHTAPPSSSSSLLESALKYLSELRSCARPGEALSTAAHHGLATEDLITDKHDDFIMDPDELSPLPFSSWLQPGAVFEGHQHATTAGASLTHHPPRTSGSHIEQINPNYRDRGIHATTTGFDHPPGSTRVAPFDASRPWLSHQFTPPTHHPSSGSHAKLHDPPHDQWPVRVTIHSINPEKMTLQGTMEAYDVPQHPASLSILHSADHRPKAGKKNAPITTYLEGHIIDLRTHSFLTPTNPDGKDKSQSRGGSSTTTTTMTPSYTTLTDTIFFPSANPHTDATNWRKLPPFTHLASDNELAHTLLSKPRMEAINQEYIFMRWKERCFVHGKDDKCSAADRGGDQDRGHGLTISGFYYVSLRRSDGGVEGLYFDPTSTPYQYLRLRGLRGGWPAFGFR